MTLTRQQQKGTLHFHYLVDQIFNGKRVTLDTPKPEEHIMVVELILNEAATLRIIQLEQEVISLCELIDEHEKQLQELRHDMMLEIALLKEAIKCT